MINLPVLHQLEIDNYGLFPGTETRPGLHTRFTSGLKLILGANGLGKTTLVTILFRMLTGPSDIPNFGSGGDLGGRRLRTAPLPRGERRIFAERVSDGAAEADVTLSFYLGETEIHVRRSLKTLELLALAVNGEETEVSEEEFEELVIEYAGVSSFGDWILALRHLVFYFEDRRALIWDASAQRQLLRLLFLPPTQAAEWTRREREILELDSAVRNRQFVLGREEREIARIERSLETAGEVRQQLKLSQQIQEDELGRLDALNDDLVTVTAARETARLNALKDEQAHESAMRNLERLELHEIEAAFPDATEVGKYIVGQILADDKCLTCGSDVPDFADEIRARIRNNECPICGSTIETAGGRRSRAKREHSKALKLAEALNAQMIGSAEKRADAENAFNELLDKISYLNERTARRSAEIRDLIRGLPPEEREIHQQQSDLANSRARLEQDRAQLSHLRQQFQKFITTVNRKIAQQKETIKAAFDQYAEGFLLEDCALLWSPQKSRVGQTGELVEYAAFEMDMTGSDFKTAHRRTGPEQVSESQREFIDLSFRMALIRIASKNGGTLIIDVPESSLDAVFATRAAGVLMRFCDSDTRNRLVVTSNLVDGDLIPALLARATIQSSRDPRIIDLLRIATPTAAVRELYADYAKVRQRLFRRASEVDK